MKLYHLTAVAPGGITVMVHGSFTAPRQQELITAAGSSLELYALRPKEGRLDPLMKVDAFAQIRALDVFRLPGTRRDYLVLTSDSGSISILAADAATATFKRVHCEPFGKSGCRRIIPGQFLACEPRGRACMVGAVEKQKFAYVLNRDAEENLTISSPLEAHKSNFATFALTSLDVGFENPMFAALERSYEKASQKLLVYYELDLGLNHVVRKLVSPVRPSSFVILPVPGHTDGPGGVLVCSSGFVTYRSLLREDERGRLLSLVEGSKPAEEQKSPAESCPEENLGQLEARIPYREGTDPDNTMIVSGTVYQDKKGNAFFFLLSTEYGDLIKAEITWDTDHGATELRLVYFDTMPGPALDMCIFRSGYLSVAIEGSDTLLLKFRDHNVPDDDPAGGVSISNPSRLVFRAAEDAMDVEKTPNGTSGHTNGTASSKSPPSMKVGDARNQSRKLMFRRRERLAFLSVAGVIDSLAPLLSICKAQSQGEDSGALVCATGRSSSGSIRALRRGMAVMEISSPHQLPSNLTNVFTFKDRADSAFHRFIVVSFEDRTKVLEVGDTKVEEILSSGFELNEATLCAGQVSTDSLLQVHKSGVRFIPGGRADDAQEWKPPVPAWIVAACCNVEQVVVALSSGSLVYFEVDAESISLQEVDKVADVLIPSGGDDSVTQGAGDEGSMSSLAIPEIPVGRKKANFFVAGDGSNNKVRLFRVGQDGTIESLGLHVAPAPIQSLALVDFGIIDKDALSNSRKKAKAGMLTYDPMLILLIGTRQGALVRLAVDAITGAMSDRRSMFLGPGPVNVEGVRIAGVPTCLAMGTRPWVLFPQGGRVGISPLSTEPMEHAASFSSEQSPDGFVTTCASRLRLLTVDLVHALVNSAALPQGLPPLSVPSGISLGCSFHLSRTRTAGTPRRIVRVAQDTGKQGPIAQKSQSAMSIEDPQDLFVTIETDHRAKYALGEDASTTANAVQLADGTGKKKGPQTAPAPMGSWFSCLQLVRLCADEQDAESDDALNEEEELEGSDPFVDLNPKAVKTIDTVTLKRSNQSILVATSSASLGPPNADPEALSYVVVSHVTNLIVSATSPDAAKDRRLMENKGHKASGALSVYKVDKKSQKLVFLHETVVSEPVYTMAPFRDMLLVGIGSAIRLYDLGKRQLLRKGEYKLAVRNKVSALAVVGGDRVFVGDMQESVTLFKYIRPGTLTSRAGVNSTVRREGGRFVPIASDSLPRWVVSLEGLDYSSVCGCDKFGNIFVLRLPSELAGATDEFAGVTSSEKDAFGPGSRSAPHKLSVEACIHVGSTVIGLTQGSFHDGSLQPSVGMAGTEVHDSAVIYSTIDGAIGLLAPFQVRSDAEFAQSLEKEMRKRYKSICGRDHTAYRSSFYPVKNVVDGDLCEMLSGLVHADQEKCAEALARPLEDVVRKLEELRSAYM